MPRKKPSNYVYTETEKYTVSEMLKDALEEAKASGEFKGDKGDKGDPFTYDDFTPEQLEALKPVKGTDYFTDSEVKQIQNEVSSGAIGDFKSVVDSETNKYNTNATEKLNTYNSNAETKTAAYNQNADNRVADFEIARQNAAKEIKDAENAALENIGTGIDDTLTQSGKAADAKVTGDRLNELKEDLDNYFYEKLLNGWDADNRIDGKFFAGNGALSDSAIWCYSPTYVEVKPNTSYVAKCKISSGIGDAITAICFYDNDKNFIEQQYDVHPSVSPSNAKYVRISVRTTYTNEFVFAEEYDGYKTFGYLYAIKDSVYIKKLDDIERYINASNPLYGKILCSVGDSITYGADMDAEGITNESNITVYNCDGDGNFTETTSNFLKTYSWNIASRNNMTLYNGGVSGSVVASVSDRNGFALPNGRYTKLPVDIDYLTIWFGWNDYAEITSGSGLESLGNLSSTDTNTFYGAYNTVLDYITEHYPNTKICLCVPFGANGDIRGAVRSLANYWGVACWDNTEGGTPLYYNKEYDVSVNDIVLERNRAKFQANGAHPNAKGHLQISHMLEHFLRGI